jgi:hypothetical protein
VSSSSSLLKHHPPVFPVHPDLELAGRPAAACGVTFGRGPPSLLASCSSHSSPTSSYLAASSVLTQGAPFGRRLPIRNFEGVVFHAVVATLVAVPIWRILILSVFCAPPGNSKTREFCPYQTYGYDHSPAEIYSYTLGLREVSHPVGWVPFNSPILSGMVASSARLSLPGPSLLPSPRPFHLRSFVQHLLAVPPVEDESISESVYCSL